MKYKIEIDFEDDEHRDARAIFEARDMRADIWEFDSWLRRIDKNGHENEEVAETISNIRNCFYEYFSAYIRD